MVKIHGLFSSFSENLGDYIQTFAAEDLLGGFDGFTDRENLKQESRECILISNGWWKHSVEDFPPPPHITPVYTGIHLARPGLFERKLVEHFNLHGPVGCRDDYTRTQLEKIGVEAYRSGCLTLSLRRWIEPSYGGPVIAIDPPSGLTLPPNTQVFSNIGPRNSHPSIMREAALSRLAELQRASMVITTRLHVALPCLAFGTPVILLADKSDPRFTAAKDLLPVHDPKTKVLPEASLLDDKKREHLRNEIKIDLIKQVGRAVERHYGRSKSSPGLSIRHSYDKSLPGKEGSLIPRVIHQFASDPGTLPTIPSECMETVREFGARNQYCWKLWTPRTVERLLTSLGAKKWLQLLGACRNYGEYGDIARYAILFLEGGWWFDWDLRVMHAEPLAFLMSQNSHFSMVGLVDDSNDVVANEFIGARHGCGPLKSFLETLQPANFHSPPTPQYTGPYGLTKHLRTVLSDFRSTRLLSLGEVLQGSFVDVKKRGAQPSPVKPQPLFHHWTHSWMGKKKMHTPHSVEVSSLLIEPETSALTP